MANNNVKLLTCVPFFPIRRSFTLNHPFFSFNAFNAMHKCIYNICTMRLYVCVRGHIFLVDYTADWAFSSKNGFGCCSLGTVTVVDTSRIHRSLKIKLCETRFFSCVYLIDFFYRSLRFCSDMLLHHHLFTLLLGRIAQYHSTVFQRTSCCRQTKRYKKNAHWDRGFFYVRKIQK